MISIPNYSFHWKTPDGVATIFIIESSPISINVFIGKSGTSLAAMIYALVEFINLSFRSSSIEDVISILSDITTQTSVLLVPGIECRSTPEAISFALTEYVRIKKREAKR